MSEYQGKFVWYELMTFDTAAAKKFYGDVVGWTMTDTDGPGFTYTILSADGKGVAGLFEMPEEPRKAGAGPFWTGYIWADDVDAMAERVTAAGGAVHRAPDDIPNVGRFAVVADPYGAAFCLFKGLPQNDGGTPKTDLMMKPGHTGWHELMAGDLDGAFAFYADLFGWEKGDPIDMGPMGVYQLFGKDGVMMGGIMKKPEGSPVGWGYYFTVPEIRAAAERVKAAGGSLMTEPMEVPGGAWIIHATDPQGAYFALVAPPA
jgi:predicted enzyme related to lactoylglutathione lyase